MINKKCITQPSISHAYFRVNAYFRLKQFWIMLIFESCLLLSPCLFSRIYGISFGIVLQIQVPIHKGWTASKPNRENKPDNQIKPKGHFRQYLLKLHFQSWIQSIEHSRWIWWHQSKINFLLIFRYLLCCILSNILTIFPSFEKILCYDGYAKFIFFGVYFETIWYMLVITGARP